MTTHAPPLPEALDPDSPSAHRAGRIRWWFWVGILVIAPLVLVVAAVLAVVVLLYGQYAAALGEVKLEVVRIQAAGEPITTPDLYAYHRPASGTKDITGLWLAALNSVNEQQFNTDAKPLPFVGDGDRKQLPASDLPGALDLLANYDATVQATLVAARAEGECRFPVEFEDGFSALLPDAQKIRLLARLMLLRGRAAAAQNEADKAVESVEAIFASSRAMSHQLTLVEHLVRIANATIALNETEFLLNEMDLTDQQLARLEAEVRSLDPQQGLTTGLLGERAMGYHAFHHMEQMSGGNIVNPPKPGEGTLSRPADCRMYLGFFQEMIEASRQPFPEAIDGANKSEARLKLLAGNRNPLERYNSMVTLLILPATATSFQATATNLARRDLTLCAVASQRHRLQHGKLPASLAELAPEFLPAVPTDPFDGQPLRMIAAGEELVFYSVGKDRKDDGGVEAEDREEPDIVVRLTTKP